MRGRSQHVGAGVGAERGLRNRNLLVGAIVGVERGLRNQSLRLGASIIVERLMPGGVERDLSGDVGEASLSMAWG